MFRQNGNLKRSVQRDPEGTRSKEKVSPVLEVSKGIPWKMDSDNSLSRGGKLRLNIDVGHIGKWMRAINFQKVSPSLLL